MGIEGVLILVVIIIVAGYFFGSQIQTYLDDIQQSVKTQQNQADTKIPAPKNGDRVCNLLVKFEPKVTGSLTQGNILHLNENGGKISYNWQNCHTKTLSWLNLMQLYDFLDMKIRGTDLPKNELGIPIVNVFEEKFKVSFKLVDQNLRTKLVPTHQDIQFRISAGIQAGQTVSYDIKFFELIPEQYTLEITIDSNNYRFGNHEFGEPYKQIISPPSK